MEPTVEDLARALAKETELRNSVYAERDMCVALIYHMARKLGYCYGLRESSDFEPGWQKCVMIDLPTGQISWHIQDSEQEWFAEDNMLKSYGKEWDGHSTREKYGRVLAYGMIDQASSSSQRGQTDEKGEKP